MKKILRKASAFFAIAMMVMMTSLVARADDCSKSVGKICTDYNDIAGKINAAATLQELMGIDFIGQIMKASESVDKDCYSYELTDADKDGLIKAFDNVMQTLVDRADFFTDGAAGGMIKGQLQPMLDEYHDSVSETKTLGDYVTSMQQ